MDKKTASTFLLGMGTGFILWSGYQLFKQVYQNHKAQKAWLSDIYGKEYVDKNIKGVLA